MIGDEPTRLRHASGLPPLVWSPESGGGSEWMGGWVDGSKARLAGEQVRRGEGTRECRFDVHAHCRQ